MTRFLCWLRSFWREPEQTWAPTPEEEFGNFRRVAGIYAKAGDIITCENGHSIAVFCRDVRVGDLFDGETLSFEWAQVSPEIGTISAPCVICGKRWFKGAYYHFKDGWRIA